MYEPHPDLDPLPDDDSTIWRYLSFTKLVSVLKDQALFFSSMKHLKDKYEGMFTQPIVEAQREARKNSPTIPKELIPKELLDLE